MYTVRNWELGTDGSEKLCLFKGPTLSCKCFILTVKALIFLLQHDVQSYCLVSVSKREDTDVFW